MTSKLPADRSVLVARCHEIQAALSNREVGEFEAVIELGMALRLALHIRGLPLLNYETVKLVAYHYLGIPRMAMDRLVKLLADVEFVALQTTGQTINAVLPKVPYYEELYDQLGEYAEKEKNFNEAEQLALILVDRLAGSPENVDSLRNALGADSQLFSRGVAIGTQGSYLIKHRARGRDILLNPTYFSQNSAVFADAAAAQGASSIKTMLDLVRLAQGWPLGLIEKQKVIGQTPLTDDQIKLLVRLAQDGAVKPPSITTTHAGENFFIFTPTPTGAAMSPTKRDIYERAMAVIASLRQGQLLPERFAIRSPQAVLNALRTNLRLGRATTEATQQYSQLVHMRVARLAPSGSGYATLEIVDTPENREALEIADTLLSTASARGLEVDDEARRALQKDLKYVESLVSASKLRERELMPLSQPMQEEIDLMLLGEWR